MSFEYLGQSDSKPKFINHIKQSSESFREPDSFKRSKLSFNQGMIHQKHFTHSQSIAPDDSDVDDEHDSLPQKVEFLSEKLDESKEETND